MENTALLRTMAQPEQERPVPTTIPLLKYPGLAGEISNCQIGVLTSYLSRHGHAFIERAHYLLKEWMNDPERLKAAHVLDEVGVGRRGN